LRIQYESPTRHQGALRFTVRWTPQARLFF